MWSTRRRIALAFLAVVGAAIVVAGGSAGNRTAEVTFEAFPGPASVSYVENIAYTTTFKNTGGSNFTHVQSHQRVPVATFEGVEYPATLVASTCGAVIQGNEAVCAFGSLAPDQSLSATFVWQAPTIPSASGCDGCLTTKGRWLIKEGKPTNSNDEFPAGGINVPASLVDGAQETLRAGGYEIDSASCSGASAPGNLRTNQSIGLSNPITTKFCLPPFTLPPGQGFASTVTETLGNARHTEVCIAALGTNCGPGAVDANFFPGGVVTVVIRALLPKAIDVTKVFHNGVEMTPATCAATGDCVVSINSAKFNSSTKLWTIVVTSGKNGFYDF